MPGGAPETLWRLTIERLKPVLERVEPYNPLVFFAAGFGYDSATLTRIDRFLDNAILLAYLALLGLAIILGQRVELEKTQSERIRRLAPYLTLATHFLFCGLFSAYVIFYFKSVSFTRAVLFLMVLVALLLANEFLPHRLRNAHLLLALYFFCLFSFLIYFIPVVTGRMDRAVFIVSGLGGMLVVALLAVLIHLGGLRASLPEMRRTGLWVGSVFGVLLLLYFTRAIPPVPLSLKTGGIYHGVRWRKKERRYELTRTAKPWYGLHDDDRPFEKRPGDRVYCFTSVFAPEKLRKRIVHRWRPYDEREGEYREGEAITYTIQGGREGGFRGYTYKRNTHPGKWRVDVETPEGLVLGRIDFEIEDVERGGLEMEKVYY